MLDDSAEADEATQDAFVLALKRIDSFRGQADFKTWLYAITLNVCRGRLRQRHSRARVTRLVHALFSTDKHAPPQPEHAALQSERDALVWQAIHALPEHEREAVVLRYYHELSTTEIAQIAGVSDRAVRTRLQNAHAKIRAQLQGKVEWE
ncbi:MAG: RNA polymerase sigma factor [Chloroflexi bacterium]|nr:RNA polymerase sigma factor [Chloroflexota bacterium]